MPKTTTLPVTQNIKNNLVTFGPADLLSVIAVSPTAVGSNLSPGARTFTAAAGTTQTGGVGAATWTCNASGGAGAAILTGVPTITQPGAYMGGAGPTAAANAATVDSGSSNATWALTVGVLKTIVTAGANDEIVDAINVASSDSAARIMSLWLQADTGSHPVLIGSVNVPLNSGGPASGTVAAIDLIGSGLMPGLSLNQNGKRVYKLQAGYKLLASVPAVTASCYITVTPSSEAY
jgi:hypothetical protein